MARKKGEELSAAFRERIGKGRPKGVPNKHTIALKEMVLMALSDAGGVNYLVRQADLNPAAFLALVGKVLPMTVTGPGDNGEHVVEVIWRRAG